MSAKTERAPADRHHIQPRHLNDTLPPVQAAANRHATLLLHLLHFTSTILWCSLKHLENKLKSQKKLKRLITHVNITILTLPTSTPCDQPQLIIIEFIIIEFNITTRVVCCTTTTTVRDATITTDLGRHCCVPSKMRICTANAFPSRRQQHRA
eukprot:6477795-Amphidinium_carterae.2